MYSDSSYKPEGILLSRNLNNMRKINSKQKGKSKIQLNSNRSFEFEYIVLVKTSVKIGIFSKAKLNYLL